MTRSIANLVRALSKWVDESHYGLLRPYLYEVEALRKHYRLAGISAAIKVGDFDEFKATVIEQAVKYLYFRRRSWRPLIEGSSALAKKLNEGRFDWTEIEFGIRRNYYLLHPNRCDLGSFPLVTRDELADRCIGLAAMALADAYDEHLIQRKAEDTRKRQQEKLARLFDHESGTFAQTPKTVAYRRDLEILERLADLEDLRVRTYYGPPVQRRDIRLLTREDRTEWEGGLGGLGALGRWKDSSAPLHAAAAARAIYHSATLGYAFTVNLKRATVYAANEASKAFHSFIQERMRRELRREFQSDVPFYFVVEQGFGERPHLHGAIELPRSQESRRKLRLALMKISGVKTSTPGSERAVDVKELRTPVRWAKYAFKQTATSKHRLGVSRHLCCSRSLNERAKEQWSQMRDEFREAKRAVRKRKK